MLHLHKFDYNSNIWVSTTFKLRSESSDEAQEYFGLEVMFLIFDIVPLGYSDIFHIFFALILLYLEI